MLPESTRAMLGPKATPLGLEEYEAERKHLSGAQEEVRVRLVEAQQRRPDLLITGTDKDLLSHDHTVRDLRIQMERMDEAILRLDDRIGQVYRDREEARRRELEEPGPRSPTRLTLGFRI